MFKGGPGPVQFVNKTDAGDFRFISITPIRFRLGLHPRHSVKNNHRAIQHSKRSFHFRRKINMPGSINNIKTVFFILIVVSISRHPKTSDSGRGNSDAPFPLLFHPIGHGIAIMHFAYLVRYTGIKKHPLCCSRFACVNVRDNSNISDFFQRIISFHMFFNYLVVSITELPGKMGKSLVGFSHFVSIFFLFNSGTFILGSGD